MPAAHDASPAAELRAFRRPQVWFALFTGMIGFGGMFAVYSYISPITTEVTGLPESAVPWVLAVFGLGMTLGATVGGRFVDRSVMGTVFGSLIAVTAVLVLFGLTATMPVAAFGSVFLIGLVSQILAVRVAGPADGRLPGRAVARVVVEPLGAQHRQRRRRVAGRPGHHSRLGLHLHRLGRRRTSLAGLAIATCRSGTNGARPLRSRSPAGPLHILFGDGVVLVDVVIAFRRAREVLAGHDPVVEVLVAVVVVDQVLGLQHERAQA